MKITAVLLVKEIEPSLPFWVDRMGFEKTVEVPGGDAALAFVILVKDGAELMLQTVESVKQDAPQLLPKTGTNCTYLYIEVPDFEDARRRLEEYPVALAERITFYGMREIVVIDPGGTTVTFAARVA